MQLSGGGVWSCLKEGSEVSPLGMLTMVASVHQRLLNTSKQTLLIPPGKKTPHHSAATLSLCVLRVCTVSKELSQTQRAF